MENASASATPTPTPTNTCGAVVPSGTYGCATWGLDRIDQRSLPLDSQFTPAGNGSGGHLAGELLNSSAGIQMQHVPYKGSGQAVIDLLAGQVQVMVSGMSSVMPHIRGGKLRPLAVSSTSSRSLPA